MKTLLILFVLLFSFSVVAESDEDRLNKIEERLDKIEKFLKHNEEEKLQLNDKENKTKRVKKISKLNEEEKLQLDDKGKEVLSTLITLIGTYDEVDPNCLEKNYLSLSANQKEEFVYIFYDFPWSSDDDVKEEYFKSIALQGIDFIFYIGIIDPCVR